ncbi:MAG: methylmalonyl-CoA mutase family protein [Bacteroidales bacterium]|nr:methylmalonyl-CoA mutase family protein [Bacteroidales bacterium]
MDANKKGPEILKYFPSVSTDQWESQITKDLKGADYEKKLVWNTAEGFKVRPYYRSEDIQNLPYLNIAPNEFPFMRGAKNDNTWLIRQDIVVTDPKSANEEALEILNKGVDSLGFVVNLPPANTAFFSVLLHAIDLQAAEVNFTGQAAAQLPLLFMEWAGATHADISRITFDIDPLGELTRKSAFMESRLEILRFALAENVINTDGVAQTLAVHGDIIHNSGSTLVQELACALGMAVEYLEWLTDKGISIEKAARSMRFVFAIGSNYFMEMAKLRAARTLWAHILRAYGVDESRQVPMVIHGVTSHWNKSVYDPYVNMLRTTTETMAGVLGGVHSFTVSPFDHIFRTPTAFSRRIARNQQLILKEECYFDKVADPAAGSYYVENLTESIMDNAWRQFLILQEQGGYLNAFTEGKIQEVIKTAAQKRDMNLALRRENLLGTNQFPNFGEIIEEGYGPEIFCPERSEAPEAFAEPLTPYRGAMAFEALRYKTDQYTKRNNHRPLAFMLPIGNMAMRKARAQFSCNFFACGGFDVVDHNGFKTISEGVHEAKAVKADIVVLCSSDEEYATLAPEAVNLLKDQALLVVAGYPAAIIDALKSKGIEHFIHVRSNLLESLSTFQHLTGIQ